MNQPEIYISEDYLKDLEAKSKRVYFTKLSTSLGVLVLSLSFALTLWQLKIVDADCSSPVTFPVSSFTPCTTPVTPPVTTPPVIPVPVPVEAKYAIFGSKKAAIALSSWTSSNSYRVDLSTRSDMSWNVYLDFIHTAPDQYGNLVDNNPQKWDKYQCGATLYWRVISEDRKYLGPIKSGTIFCDDFINLKPVSTSLSPNSYGTVSVRLTGYNNDTNFGKYTIGGVIGGLEPSTVYYLALCKENGDFCDYTPIQYRDITTDTNGFSYLVNQTISSVNIRSNKISTIRLLKGQTVVLSGGYNSPVEPTSDFSNLSASLSADSAVFNFIYSDRPEIYRVDLSTRADMDWDVYLSYAVGSANSLIVSDPGKWDQYDCGKTLYWRVWNTNRTKSSSIQSSQVNCSGKIIARSRSSQVVQNNFQTVNTKKVSELSKVDAKLKVGNIKSLAVVQSTPSAAAQQTAFVPVPSINPAVNVIKIVRNSVSNTILNPIAKLAVYVFRTLNFFRFIVIH